MSSARRARVHPRRTRSARVDAQLDDHFAVIHFDHDGRNHDLDSRSAGAEDGPPGRRALPLGHASAFGCRISKISWDWTPLGIAFGRTSPVIAEEIAQALHNRLARLLAGRTLVPVSDEVAALRSIRAPQRSRFASVRDASRSAAPGRAARAGALGHF